MNALRKCYIKEDDSSPLYVHIVEIASGTLADH